MRKILIFACLTFLLSCTQQSPGPAVPESSPVAAPADPLPSWNDVDSKKAITEFVMKVTKAGSPDFIPVEDRIACFDNDGTLWSEQPMYFQLICALDLVKAAAPHHPEWKTKEPFASILKGDLKKAMAGGEKSLLQIVMATQAGMNTDEFDQLVKEWLTTSKHPRFNRPYNEMVYQPMLELLAYLRANEFKTFIVSGGEEGFMCAWAGKTYNIPCEQTIGTTLKSEYHVKNDTPQIMRIPALNAMNDGKGKPVGIYEQIGKRPVFTAGNSDGDYEMLQWTTTATGYPGFGMIVHHTDSLREWAYDRGSHIGKLDRGLDDAAKYKWQIVDMKADWKVIFPFD